jgi:pyrroline-5-carboxylate reductase
MAELVIVGGGNMGAALAGGLVRSGWRPDAVAVVELMAVRRAQLHDELPGVVVVAEPTPEVVSGAGVVIAVKPGDAVAAAGVVAALGARRVLSIAAGVRLDALEAACGDGVAVVRSMPNTPALVGEGMAAIAPGRSASGDDVAWATAVLSAVGQVVQVAEGQLDAVTGVAGSGPAYLFLVAEAMIDAGVAEGLPRTVAETLVRQLFVGVGALLGSGQGDAPQLRAMVTSPGGTTAAGLAALERHAVRAAFAAAVGDAARRSRELG